MEFLADEEFQHLSVASILKHSIAIAKSSPKLFFIVSLCFIFPLSLANLVHFYLMHSLMHNSHIDPSRSMKSLYNYYTLVLFFQFFYSLYVFAFSLLSSSISIFAVATLYTCNSTSFSTIISALPSIFPRLFSTFLWAGLIMFIYNAIFYIYIPIAAVTLYKVWSFELSIFILITFFSLFFLVEAYAISVWQVASVVSVLEPPCGQRAMKRSMALLDGKTLQAMVLVMGYIFLFGGISLVFDKVVRRSWESEVWTRARILIGVVLVGLLVGLNLLGLMVQSLFYFVCKSFHQESIDKIELLDLLGGYVNANVKLDSTIHSTSY